MTKIEAEIIVGLAENNLNIAQTAQNMRCHRNTVLYHINKIRQETGTNPTCFRDMHRLLSMAEKVLNCDATELSDVEIVTRCGACAYWLEEFGEVCAREEDWFYTAPDDFCSRAVSRGEAS